MKRIKTIITALFTMAIIFTMTVSVMASEIVITSENGNSEKNYTYYVMMKSSIVEAADHTTMVAYYVENQSLADALSGLTVDEKELFQVTKVSNMDCWNIVIKYKDEENKTEFTSEELAEALYTIKELAIASGTSGEDGISLEYEAFLLIESDSGLRFVADTDNTPMIIEKNIEPKISASQNDAETAEIINTEIGEKIVCKILLEIPKQYTKEIKIFSTLSHGLTLDNKAIATDNTDITGLSWQEVTGNDSSSKKYEVLLSSEQIKSITNQSSQDGKIILTYAVVLNENTVVNQKQSNKVYMEYNTGMKSVEVEMNVTTFGFTLHNVNGKKEALSGSKFTLKKVKEGKDYYYKQPTDENNITEARFQIPAISENTNTIDLTNFKLTTDAAGSITFSGLGEGTYTLTQMEAPMGYYLLETPITVTIDKNGNAKFSGDNVISNGSETENTTNENLVVIENKAGIRLPSTGSSGTIICYMLGSILVLGSGSLLIARRRMFLK